MKRNRRPTRDDGRSFRPLFERYLEWITVHNFSPETVKTKRYQLERFEGWCKERDIDRPVEVTRALIERYQRSVFHFRQKNGRPLGRSTQNGYVSAVCVFFRWLKKRGYILSNPASELELPKIDKRLPRHVLSAIEVERVLYEIDIDERLGLRDRAIIEVLYSTGIRRAELLHLKLYDVDRDRGTLMIRLGKGKKDRIVPIGERALLWLEKYIEEWRPLYVCGKDDGEIFLGVRGKPLLELSLLRIVRKRLVAAELYKHGSGCHVFRHTAATLMLEGGADIRFIQDRSTGCLPALQVSR
jgi:integrase/recombinase XerD